MKTLRDLSEAEQREAHAKFRTALNDLHRAQENYNRLLARAPRLEFLGGLAVGLLIGGVLLLGLWLLTQSVR
jgi:hypothetical protein